MGPFARTTREWILRKHDLAFSRRAAPEVCKITLPHENQRAQGRPGARCTRGLACMMHKKMRTRAYRFSGEHPAFPAQWLYGLLRARPGDRLSCHRHQQNYFRQLDASTGASGPHDFTVRSGIVRPHIKFAPTPSRPPLPVPRLRRWPTPLGGTGWRELND